MLQNDMPMTTGRSKAEVQFQYSGRPFSKIGSSNDSAVDWAILSNSHRNLVCK